MATRINTKLAVILAAALVVFAAGGYWAVTTFVIKSAAQNAAIADEAMAQARTAYASGDYELSNDYADRAARRYHAAHRKDIGNTDHLYNSIVANEFFICTSETEAENRLGMVLSAAQLAHNSLRATEEDSEQLYARLMERHRVGLVVDGFRPWVANISNIAEEQLQANPDDSQARRWRGIAGVYILRNDMPPEERAIPLDDLTDALTRSEGDPVLLHHIALWHYKEAGRLRSAGGDANNAQADEHITQMLAFSRRAHQAAPDDPYTIVQHLVVLLQAPLIDVHEKIGELLLPLGRRLAEDPDARAQLYTNEVMQVVTWLTAYPTIESQIAAEQAREAEAGDSESTPAEAPAETAEGQDTEGGEAETHEAITLAIRIGEAMVSDDPDALRPREVLAVGLLAKKDYFAAIETLEAGLASAQPLNPMAYLLQREARISMLATLVNTYATMAADTNSDPEARAALLDQADEALARYRAAEGADSLAHQANADFLAGRTAFVRQTPHLAIQHLERANLHYQNTNLQVLQILAKAYDQRNYIGEAAKYYELVLLSQPRARNIRLRLVQLYIKLGGDYLRNADEHITEYLNYNSSDLQAILLKAQVMAAYERFDLAANLIGVQDLEAMPQLIGLQARYLHQAGESEEALRLTQERLATEPNDLTALGVLFTILDGQDVRLAALDTLITNGLNAENERRFRALIESGGTFTAEELAAFLREGGDTSELVISKQLFMRYANEGNAEMMRETLAQLNEVAPNDPDVLNWRYGVAVQDRDWPLAGRLLDQILELPVQDRPQNAVGDGIFLRAQVLTGQIKADAPEGSTPDLREAIRAYRRALESHPTHAEGWVELGQLYIIQQDWQRARDALNRAHQIQPTNRRVSVLLPQVLRMTGEVDLALDLYRDAIRRMPNNRTLLEEYITLEYLAGIPRLATERREAMRESDPEDTANRLALAVMYAQTERFEDALSELEAVIQLDGESLRTTSAQADIHAMNEDVQRGVGLYDAYLSQRGDEADERDLLSYAMFLGRNNRIDAAEVAFQQAIAIEDPQTRASSRQWASILNGLTRHAESARLYQELVQAFPNNDALKTELATVLMNMGSYDRALTTLAGAESSADREHLRARVELQRGDPVAALAIARQALQTYNDDDDLHALEANLLTRLAEQDIRDGNQEQARSRFNEALVIYDRLVQRNERLYEIRVVMAQIERALGNTDAAANRLLRILDERPGNVAARSTLFSVYMAQALAFPEGDTRRQDLAQTALSVITPLIDSQPDNAGALRGAARAASEAGNHTRAAAYYRSAFEQSDAVDDLTGLVGALLSSNKAGEVNALLGNPDLANHLRDTLSLRAMQARALADTNQTQAARNQFTSLVQLADNPVVVSVIISQIERSALSREVVQIVEQATGSDREPAIEILLALHESDRQLWDSVIARVEPVVASPTGDAAIDNRAKMVLADAYQQTGTPEYLTRSKELYEYLLDLPENRDNVEMLNNLAYVLTDKLPGQENARLAVGYAQRAVDLMADNQSLFQRAMVMDTLGWAQFNAGETDAAIETFKESIALSSLWVNHMHLGVVYMSLNTQRGDDLAVLQLDEARRKANTQAEQAEIQRLLEQL